MAWTIPPNLHWNTADVAGYLKTTQAVVRFLCRHGLIPYHEIHIKLWRYDPEEIKATVAELGWDL